jgi:hypothetical protein
MLGSFCAASEPTGAVGRQPLPLQEAGGQRPARGKWTALRPAWAPDTPGPPAPPLPACCGSLHRCARLGSCSGAIRISTLSVRALIIPR